MRPFGRCGGRSAEGGGVRASEGPRGSIHGGAQSPQPGFPAPMPWCSIRAPAGPRPGPFRTREFAMSSQTQVFVVGAARTPIGKFLGGLSGLKASDLGAVAIREALRRAGVAGNQVDEVLMGHVVQGGQGQAPARQAQIKAGVDPAVGAVTINKVCGSGLKAVMLGAQAIRAGDAECVVAGGMESMSTAPHYLFTGRTGNKLGDQSLRDGAVHDGLWCSFNDCHMIELAQYTA